MPVKPRSGNCLVTALHPLRKACCAARAATTRPSSQRPLRPFSELPASRSCRDTGDFIVTARLAVSRRYRNHMPTCRRRGRHTPCTRLSGLVFQRHSRQVDVRRSLVRRVVTHEHLIAELDRFGVGAIPATRQFTLWCQFPIGDRLAHADGPDKHRIFFLWRFGKGCG